MKIIGGIYEIRNIQNDKIYIGSSKNIKQRWKQHKYLLNNNKHHSPHLQNAWNKYSESNFDFNVVKYVEDDDVLLDEEQRWLDSTQCYERDIGYNISKDSRTVVYDNILPEVIEKKDIQIYVSTMDEKYIMKVQGKDYKYVDREGFIYDLYKYYETNTDKRDYTVECFLYNQGLYFDMKELININPDTVKGVFNSLKIDLISFNNYILGTSSDFYISKIIDYKYKMLKRKDILIIETVDKKYEITLNGSD